jgi:hypothetical protein
MKYRNARDIHKSGVLIILIRVQTAFGNIARHTVVRHAFQPVRDYPVVAALLLRWAVRQVSISAQFSFRQFHHDKCPAQSTAQRELGEKSIVATARGSTADQSLRVTSPKTLPKKS